MGKRIIVHPTKRMPDDDYEKDAEDRRKTRNRRKAGVSRYWIKK